MERRLRDAIRLIESEGFTVTGHEITGSGHYRFQIRHSDGTEFATVFSCSPSDYRVDQQRRKQLRRSHREACECLITK